MRRVDGDEAPSRIPLARGVDRGANLGRVMRVVIDDGHAATLAEDLETARGTAEVGARSAPRSAGVDPGVLRKDQRRACVLRVVESREGEHGPRSGGAVMPLHRELLHAVLVVARSTIRQSLAGFVP